MIECDDDFELNLSFGGASSSGGGGSGSAAKKAPKAQARAQDAPPPQAREKVMLRRQAPPSSSSAPSSPSGRPVSSTTRSDSGRTLSAKSLRRTPDPSTGKLNTTTGLVQHKVPVIGNKVKSALPSKSQLKAAAAAARTSREAPSTTESSVAVEKKSGNREPLDDPLQYHARPRDLSKDAPALGNVKQASRSEYIFTRQSFASLNMPAKVVELLEKDISNGKEFVLVSYLVYYVAYTLCYLV